MKLVPQKLYRINQYFWLLYPTEGTGAAAAAARPHDPRARAHGALATTAASVAGGWASYWSERLNCIVSFLNEGDVVMIVEVSGEQVKVINQEGVSGWINFPETEEWVKGTIVEVYSGH